jgi:hypothetical protein
MRSRRLLVAGALAIAGVAAAGAGASAPPLHLSARPSPAISRAITDFHFRATRRVGDTLRPVRGARITFAGAYARTGPRGQATIRLRLDTGTYRARACKRGLRCATTWIHVLPNVSH